VSKKSKSSSSDIIRQKIQKLQSSSPGILDINLTPVNSQESLKEFFARTKDSWVSSVTAAAEEEKMTKNEILSSKEIRLAAFKKAEERYNTVLPVLVKIDHLLEKAGIEKECNNNSTGKKLSSSGQSRKKK
jgi:hypothetical protein